jgi:hypothetical protein
MPDDLTREADIIIANMEMGKERRRTENDFLTKRPIGHDEARAAAYRLVNSHFNNPDHARVSIPARPDYDDDLVLMAYIKQQEARG